MGSDLQVAVEAARAGADVVRRGFLTRPEVAMKGVVDPVTEVDEAAEAAVLAVLERHRPDDDVLGEESGGAGWDSERVWIVDPLDGTVNFVHGLPHFSVSVALWENASPQIAVVIDVIRNEEFTAESGQGCHLNGDPTSVSKEPDFGNSLIGTGFPYDRQEHAEAYAATMAAVMARVRGIRRIGSAALDLAWVSCGRYDGFWEYSLAPWDTAAGVLLVTEAGGIVSDTSGDSYDLASTTVAATNGLIHSDLTDVVAAHLPPHLM